MDGSSTARQGDIPLQHNKEVSSALKGPQSNRLCPMDQSPTTQRHKTCQYCTPHSQSARVSGALRHTASALNLVATAAILDARQHGSTYVKVELSNRGEIYRTKVNSKLQPEQLLPLSILQVGCEQKRDRKRVVFSNSLDTSDDSRSSSTDER